MRIAKVGFLLAMVLLAVSVVQGDDDAAKKERKKFEGTWRVVALEVDGNKAPEVDAKKLTVINRADGTWILQREGEEVSKGDSLIDPARKPKTIDFMPTSGSGSGKEYIGIYELGENMRKICFGEKGNGRPTDFVAPAGSGHVFAILEREKK